MHSVCALIEQQPFGKGVACRIQQQPLHYARRQIGTAEKQSRFPASVVAAVAPAVHHQPQPCGQGSCRQHVHRDESVPFLELQHARRGIRHGEVEALLGARRGAAHCMVGAARLGNHPETAHSRTARPHGVERRAPVVAEHGFDSRRTACIRQGLEGHAARTARHEVTAFGVERHGEIARRGAGPRLRNLARSAAVGGDPKGLAEEVVRTLVPHEARVCREGVVAVRSVRRNGKIARVERIAAEYFDPPHERARFVAEFGIDVAARRHRTVRGGIDAPRTQPDRVSCHIGVLVGVDVELLLRVTQNLFREGIGRLGGGRKDGQQNGGRKKRVHERVHGAGDFWMRPLNIRIFPEIPAVCVEGRLSVGPDSGVCALPGGAAAAVAGAAEKDSPRASRARCGVNRERQVKRPLMRKRMTVTCPVS